LIIGAAADLFCAKGYGNVSMSDVADAVAVGPSALYRHFRGKQALLATVIEDALGSLDDALKGADDCSDLAVVLARVVLAGRTGVCCGGRKSPDHRTAEARRRPSGRRPARQHIRRRRPDLEAVQADLLAWCALGVANSISFCDLSMAEPGFTTLLSELIAVPLEARQLQQRAPARLAEGWPHAHRSDPVRGRRAVRREGLLRGQRGRHRRRRRHRRTQHL
jgi:AcrR family transcriptional regulator